MTRPRKQTVDYFPHSAHVNSGKTIPALISKYGEKGYFFWFRLMELLALTDGHGYDCNDELNWVHLQSYTMTNNEFLTSEILEYLVKLQAIDSKAWQKKGIWCQNFVDGISDVYRNRVEDSPTYKGFLRKISEYSGITEVRNPQSKVNQSKVNHTKVNEVEVIPEMIDTKIFAAFKEMRNKLKSPMTAHAVVLIFARLEKLQNETGHDPNRILDQSIENGWKGVYPLKENRERTTVRGDESGETW